MMDQLSLKRPGQSSSNETLLDLHKLFDDYNSTSYQVRFSSLKLTFTQIVNSQNHDLEAQILKTCQKFGEVYGLLIISSEIFYSFSVLYKKLSNLSKAKELAEKSVIFIENSENFNKMLPKFLINLASILSIESIHSKSLKLLKRSKKILKKQLNSEHPSSGLIEMLTVNLYNIAAEEEFLKDLQKAEKHYKKTLSFIDSHKLETSQTLISKILNGLKRVSAINSSKVSKENSFLSDLSSKNKSFAGRSENLPKIQKGKSFRRPASGDFRSTRSIQSKVKNFQRSKQKLSGTAHQSLPRKSQESDLPVQEFVPYKSSELPCENPFKPTIESKVTEGLKDSLENPFQQINNSKVTKELKNSLKNPFKLIKNLEGTEELKDSLENPLILEKVSKNPSLSISETQSIVFIPELKENEALGDSRSSIDLNRVSIESDIKNTSKYFQEIFNRSITSIREKNEDEGKEVLKAPEIPKGNYLMIDDLEIENKKCKTFYSLDKSLKIIEIRCVLDGREYQMITPLPTDIPALDFIENKLKKYLTIKNEQLVIEKQRETLLIQGEIRMNHSSQQISITRIEPRWDIKVKIGSFQEIFHIQDILNFLNVDHSTFLMNNLQFLISFFTVKVNRIVPRFVETFPFTLLKKKKFKVNENKLGEIEIYVFRSIGVSQDAFPEVFFIQGSKPEFMLKPLLVESEFLAHKSISLLKESENSPKKSMQYIKALPRQENLSLLKKTLILGNDNQITIDLQHIIFNSKYSPNNKKQTKSPALNHNRRVSLISTMKSIDISDQSLPILLKKVPESNSKSEDIINDQNKLYLAGVHVKEDFFNDTEIILHFSIYEFGQIFQVYMKYLEDLILTFIICRGIAKENRRRYSVEVKDIAKKIGIPENHIVALGSYIVRHLLVIKSIDVVYIDLNVDMTSPLESIQKFSGLIRRFITKRANKKRLQNLVGKRKLKLNDKIYTALVYINNEILYLRLVKPAEWNGTFYSYKKVEVLSLDMNFTLLVKFGFFPSLEKFFQNFAAVGITLSKINDKKILKCDPRFSLKL